MFSISVARLVRFPARWNDFDQEFKSENTSFLKPSNLKMYDSCTERQYEGICQNIVDRQHKNQESIEFTHKQQLVRWLYMVAWFSMQIVALLLKVDDEKQLFACQSS